MWELIRANRRKSFVIFIFMGILLLALGYIIGASFMPPDGGIVGLVIAFLVWGIWSLISYFSGDSIILKISGAKEVTPDVHPRLFNVVEEMKIAASLPKMPKVYIVDSPALNAFAIGRKPEISAIAVTAGLLAKLNRDELQGVVAHETSHIMNRDVQLMTFAGIMLGTIVMLSHIFLRGMFYSGASRRYRGRSSKDSGQGQAIVMIVAIVFAILAPIMAQLLYLAISRKREYLADASGARLTRYPEGLASALEKISNSKEDLRGANKATAPMYIANPLKKKGKKLSNLSSTHPPISERIKILRAMAGGAGLNNYQEAFSKITGKSGIIPSSGIADKEKVSIRDKFADREAKQDQRSIHRDTGDIMRAVNRYLFMACIGCGLKIKIPPNFRKKEFNCPRCKTKLEVPIAELATAAAVLEGVDMAGKKTNTANMGDFVYRRKGTGWESFKCSCGKTHQISPHFSATHISCDNCGRKIVIR